MPAVDNGPAKRNKNIGLLDFELKGIGIALQDRPSPINSRPNSRTDYLRRPMSATPSMFFQDREGNRWSGSSPRRTKSQKNKSIGVRLKPGLVTKPPLPPAAFQNSSINTPVRHKSLDDIVNIKFQRWFPESVVKNLGFNTSNLKDEEYEEGCSGVASGRRSVESSVAESSRTESRLSTDIEIDCQDNRRILPVIQCKPDRLDSSTGSPEGSKERNGLEFSRKPKAEWSFQDSEESLKKEEVCANGDAKASNWRDVKLLTSKIQQVWAEDENDRNTERIPVEECWKNNGSEKVHDAWASGRQDTDVPVRNPVNDGKEITDTNRCVESWKEHKVKAKCQTAVNDIDNCWVAGSSQIIPASGHVSWSEGVEKKTSSDKSDKSMVENDPSQPSQSKREQILSWMGTNCSNASTPDRPIESTYDELISMIKTIEHEEVESIKLDLISTGGQSTNNSVCSNPVASRDIMLFLDEVESKEEDHTPVKPMIKCPDPGTELAKRCSELSQMAEDKSAALEHAKSQITELQSQLEKQKAEAQSTVKRHQSFIEQVMKEKRAVGEQCATLVRELQTKHATKLRELEERHAVDLKTLEQKLQAAEKIRRDKWVDKNTKKIKELTVKGMESELQRISATHQDELKELRRCHEKELADLESAWQRRVNTFREHSLRDREIAVQAERDAASAKIEEEKINFDRKWQDEKKKIAATLREDRSRLERDLDESLITRNRELEEKWTRAAKSLDDKLADATSNHQRELKIMEEKNKEARELWKKELETALAEREHAVREECHKERDKHITAIITKLDEEAVNKEKQLDARLQKIKADFERESLEQANALTEMKRKISDYKAQIERLEEALRVSECRASTARAEAVASRAEGERLGERRAETEILSLRRELANVKSRMECMELQHNRDTQRELAAVYNRVRETVLKKDELIKSLKEQRDASIERCSQVELALSQLTSGHR